MTSDICATGRGSNDQFIYSLFSRQYIRQPRAIMGFIPSNNGTTYRFRCVSACMCRSVYLSVCLSVSFRLSVCLSVCLSAMFMCVLRVCICVSVCLYALVPCLSLRLPVYRSDTLTFFLSFPLKSDFFPLRLTQLNKLV